MAFRLAIPSSTSHSRFEECQPMFGSRKNKSVSSSHSVDKHSVDKRGLAALSLAIACAAVAGCGAAGGSGGPPVYPVTGVVKLNGQPVVGADIVFNLKDGTGSSFGRTDSSGHYQLTTRRSNDGALPGDYIVVISKADEAPAVDRASIPQDSANYNPFVGKAAPVKPKSKSGFPAKYADAKTSGQTARVLEEKNTIDFDLK
jgi:hypothetical protein